jgi:nitroreductase
MGQDFEKSRINTVYDPKKKFEMELKEAIEKRRTIRDFLNRNVPDEIILYALENAFKAPSYNHMRDWNFIIIKSLEAKAKILQAENMNQKINLAELVKLFENEDEIKKEMYLDAIPKQKKMILEAPVTIMAIFKPKTSVRKAHSVYDLNCLASAWACIENLLLSLAEHDVFGVTFIPQHSDKVKEKFGIPKDLEIAAIIPIGYKLPDARILKQKPIDIQERIHSENW